VGDNTVLMLAQTRVGQEANLVGVVQFHGYSPTPIMPPSLVYRISSMDVINDAVAWMYSDEGHTFYIITFPSEDVTLPSPTFFAAVSSASFMAKVTTHPVTEAVPKATAPNFLRTLILIPFFDNITSFIPEKKYRYAGVDMPFFAKPKGVILPCALAC